MRAIVFAFLAAALYALNAPFSKLLLQNTAPTMMAAFLYLGAGAGMLLKGILFHKKERCEQALQRKYRPYIAGMIVLDIFAPILLMAGLHRTSSASASLLNNFEIVATALLALLLFQEKISVRLWCGIILITISSIVLSVEELSGFRLSVGSLLVLSACLCWGLENNCTRMLSHSDPQQIVVVKGIGSGLGALLVGIAMGESLPSLRHVPLILLLGFVSYGLSIYCYVYAQRTLGAARTSAYYAVAPFLGVLLSLLIFQVVPSRNFWYALSIMIGGAYLVTMDQLHEQ